MQNNIICPLSCEMRIDRPSELALISDQMFQMFYCEHYSLPVIHVKNAAVNTKAHLPPVCSQKIIFQFYLEM